MIKIDVKRDHSHYRPTQPKNQPQVREGAEKVAILESRNPSAKWKPEHMGKMVRT